MITTNHPLIRHALLASLMLVGLCCASTARAHESRPAYLQITETVPDRYDVIWRTPLLSGMRLPVVLKLPADVRNITEPAEREFPGSLVERRLIATDDGLAGKRIEFVGLQATITDVLVRVQLNDGRNSTTLVHPSRPSVEIATPQGMVTVAEAYFVHGMEHILFGFDHLLFVLALILIVPDLRVLLWTITAFTIAHSITLTAATLGWCASQGRRSRPASR
jgi:HupE / UreJ protein